MGSTERARARRVLASSAAAPVQARMVVDSNWRRVTARSMLGSRKTDRGRYLVLCGRAAKRKPHTAMAVGTRGGALFGRLARRIFQRLQDLALEIGDRLLVARTQGAGAVGAGGIVALGVLADAEILAHDAAIGRDGVAAGRPRRCRGICEIEGIDGLGRNDGEW